MRCLMLLGRQERNNIRIAVPRPLRHSPIRTRLSRPCPKASHTSVYTHPECSLGSIFWVWCNFYLKFKVVEFVALFPCRKDSGTLPNPKLPNRLSSGARPSSSSGRGPAPRTSGARLASPPPLPSRFGKARQCGSSGFTGRRF